MVKLVLSLVALAVLLPFASSLYIPESSKAFADSYEAPIHTSSNAKIIPNQWIVVFHQHADESAISQHHSFLQTTLLATRPPVAPHQQTLGRLNDIFGRVQHSYNLTNLLKGYSGTFSEGLIDLLRKDPAVAYIEPDQEVHILAQEKNAPWGLARVSHKESLSFNTFNKYDYDDRGGQGVTGISMNMNRVLILAYVVDTGVNIHHEEFEGRASWGATIPENDEDADGNGHGTHVAGTIASKTYGVAKKAKIVAVKVLRSNGSGTMSDVLKGVEWAAEATAKQEKEEKKKGKKSKYKVIIPTISCKWLIFEGSTANMSLGGGSSKTLDMAVNAAVEAGLHFAVAAGNDNQDACNYSPAAAEKAVTVGASTLADARAYFSNHGKCVDIFAPGLNILSTWIGSKYATNTISGTSMASPHICGLLTYFLSLAPSSDSDYTVPVTPAKLKKRMVNIATPDMLTDIPSGTVNLLAWNGGISGNGSSKFRLEDAEKKHSWKEAVREEFEMIEKEGKEWIDKAKGFLRKEVESTL
jgi:cerevisin